MIRGDIVLIGIAPCISPDLLNACFAWATMMAPAPSDQLDHAVVVWYRAMIDKHWPETPAIARLERFAFYERSRKAYAIVMTGETIKYG